MKNQWQFQVLTSLTIMTGLLAFVTQSIATTQTASSAGVQAQYSDAQSSGQCLANPQLTIVRNGKTLFNSVLSGEGLCRQDADVFAVQDLNGDQEPEVILDFFSGGAHCCSSSLIFQYNPTQGQYGYTQHMWGHGRGARKREDLDGDGTIEIIHYDSRFAYKFSSFAGSYFPIQIWQYDHGELVDVTRQHPQPVYDNAYHLWQQYVETRNGREAGKGALAAYLATKYLLGEAEDGWARVQQAYQESDRQQFFATLEQFLQQIGYAQ